MKVFDVYQLHVGDRLDRDDNGVRDIYYILGMGSETDNIAVREGVYLGLYFRTWTVRVDDITDVFHITNGYPRASHHEVLMKAENAYSGSTGMVVIERGTDQAWQCLSCGWGELSEKTRAVFPSDEDLRPAVMPA